ncbi:mannose-1-phosphate guanylyltransferase [Parerythrobacter aurantius]|uniref:mannose-1-phosphate guanylyltransferase n=1 Tax=Parerythrobacter aurantius TaxID=3127706 RepID=UPI00324C610C
MTNLVSPVILCGGGGTRLWPRSRPDAPKPFLPLLGERSLFQQTLDRVADGTRFSRPLVVAGTRHIPLIRQQADAIDLIAEPEGKNTAPAIALAALRLPPEAVMLVCPSDHFIADTAAFVETAMQAAELARQGRLVAFGITPDAPETGYGYIRRGAPLDVGYEIDRFVEKPDLATAEQFLAEGGYSWNGGIFVFQAGRYLEELRRHRPEMAELVEAAAQAGSEAEGTFVPDAGTFSRIEGDSIDYAVMEPTDSAAVVPSTMGWSDIGNWQALRDARAAEGRGRFELVDCHNVMVDTDGPRVSVIGLDDIIVIVDGDEVLVTSAAGAQKVGKLAGATGK